MQEGAALPQARCPSVAADRTPAHNRAACRPAPGNRHEVAADRARCAALSQTGEARRHRWKATLLLTTAPDLDLTACRREKPGGSTRRIDAFLLIGGAVRYSATAAVWGRDGKIVVGRPALMISAEHFGCEHMAGRAIVVLIGGGF